MNNPSSVNAGFSKNRMDSSYIEKNTRIDRGKDSGVRYRSKEHKRITNILKIKDPQQNSGDDFMFLSSSNSELPQPSFNLLILYFCNNRNRTPEINATNLAALSSIMQDV